MGEELIRGFLEPGLLGLAVSAPQSTRSKRFPGHSGRGTAAQFPFFLSSKPCLAFLQPAAKHKPQPQSQFHGACPEMNGWDVEGVSLWHEER